MAVTDGQRSPKLKMLTVMMAKESTKLKMLAVKMAK